MLEAFRALIARYGDPALGYAARRAIQTSRTFEGDYDHLSRYGEWDETVTPDHRPVP